MCDLAGDVQLWLGGTRIAPLKDEMQRLPWRFAALAFGLHSLAICAVYVVDLFVQFSGLHPAWSKGRMAILIVGTAFAAVIAHFFAMNIFGSN